MDFWQDKDNEYRFKMVDVFAEQIADLNTIVPTFKLANATIHFDETSPHMHIVGVPVIENCSRGMKKQVAKSQVFTKESLKVIQEEMRKTCIKSYNKFYETDSKLKQKQKGRNQDINVNDMDNYKKMKKQLEQNKNKLEKANTKTKQLDNESDNIKEIINSLKPIRLNKNNMVISNENALKIKKYIENVKNNNKTIRSVNDLNVAIKDFEHSAFEVEQDNRSLKYQIELKDKEIEKLKTTVSNKDIIISKLRAEKDKIKEELKKFKNFWYGIMNRFHNKISFDKDIQYKYVSEDLHKAGVFSDDDFEIATNAFRKVKPKEEINEKEQKSKKSDRWVIKK